MTWTDWRRHFERNAERPLPPPPGDAGGVPPAWAPALASSLARFQAGETSEGRLAWQIERVDWASIDDDYRKALKLFVSEEARHARILGGWVRALGGPPAAAPRDHWSKRAFVFGRRLAGVRSKLLVALAAEVVGIAFYGLVRDRLPEGGLRQALAELCRDEEDHLAFHGDFFRRLTLTRARRGLFRGAYWPIGATAASLCLADHRRTLATLGVPMSEASARFFRLLAAVDAHVTGAPAGVTATTGGAGGARPGEKRR